ncbi:OST-HTH/LOTUS domain-containing protein [Tepidimonas sp.]|uniref:OST-HTH/LOTUS domain-containing protein n=1 Tax=Tepidimonas sp. TaxID=2002775 RepID=UPI003919A95D
MVRVLREASEALSEGGWTQVDRAREWIAENHADQTPSKYGCRTWPQVLSESKLFELVYRVGDDGKRAGWFRERLSA